jgi:lipopolysaccharide transport system ATP-binding protein
LEVGTGFHPELTGRENIFMNGAILGMRREEIKRKFDEIVAFAEVEKFLDTPVKHYSSGMYVRLAFAVAAHLEPEILIVDEVLAVGDAEFQKKCLGKMQEVSKGEGRTVLFVSHNMAAVSALCSSGLVLERGSVFKQGVATDCVEYYADSGNRNCGSVLSRLSHLTRDVAVNAIRVNGLDTQRLEISPGQRQLRVDVEGQLRCAMRLDLELTISDCHGVPLAFFSAGHNAGASAQFPTGKFLLSRSVLLPEHLHRGGYMLSIDLTHYNIRYWARCPDAVLLIVAGEATATGRPLEYADRKGFVSMVEVDSE